jgi:hypothetical protein
MSNSILKDKQGPDWPLGFIKVVTPGTPVELMSLVDSAGVNDPEAPTSATSDEYTVRAQQIIFQGFKPGAAHGTQNNTGNVYIIREGDGTGSANRDDMGNIVFTLTPGQTFTLASAPLDRNVFSPYRYTVDADNAGDGVFVTLLIQ